MNDWLLDCFFFSVFYCILVLGLLTTFLFFVFLLKNWNLIKSFPFLCNFYSPNDKQFCTCHDQVSVVAYAKFPLIEVQSIHIPELTHWPLGDLDVILKIQFSILFYWLVSWDLCMIMPSDECHNFTDDKSYGVTRPQWVKLFDLTFNSKTNSDHWPWTTLH